MAETPINRYWLKDDVMVKAYLKLVYDDGLNSTEEYLYAVRLANERYNKNFDKKSNTKKDAHV